MVIKTAIGICLTLIKALTNKNNREEKYKTTPTIINRMEITAQPPRIIAEFKHSSIATEIKARVITKKGNRSCPIAGTARCELKLIVAFEKSIFVDGQIQSRVRNNVRLTHQGDGYSRT